MASRVVFNASAKTSTGFSFNDQQLTRPKRQADLVDIFIRFRIVCGYRPNVSANWRSEKPMGFATYHMAWPSISTASRLCYYCGQMGNGISKIQFRAVRALRQCAIDNQERFSVGATVVLNDFYYDVMHTGADNQHDLFVRYEEVSRLPNTGGFKLSKGATNNNQLTETINNEEKIETISSYKNRYWKNIISLNKMMRR